MKFQTVFKRKY